ncbi:MAG: hypothetical protein E7464_05290 [Ruminococcaceae bacterium]|nr:hypothetical protein [Oscillospiraceae bacterium]
MTFFITVSTILIVIGLWNVMIGILGLFPRFCAETIGTLSKANVSRNIRDKYGSLIRVYTRYAYTYTVRGRMYRYSNEGAHSKRRLLPKARMIYIKWFPWHAYPYKFKGTKEWVFGILFLLMGSTFVFLFLSEGGVPA